MGARLILQSINLRGVQMHVFSSCFENGNGSNPEELIAAAHAGSFSLALSAQLGEVGMTANSIDTEATLTMEKTDAGVTVTEIVLDVVANIPGADQAKFDAAAEKTKAAISRLLNTNITMNTRLGSL